MKGRAGHFVTQQPGPGSFLAFVPAALPPDPPIAMDGAMQDALEKAGLSLGRLDGITRLLPDPDLFLYMYIRKEAVLSSQIEGTQSSLSDLLLFENAATPGVPEGDVKEVSNYIAAMDHGIAALKTRLPMSLRLLREVHQVLVTNTRGGDKTPGAFRTSQNWIGGTRPGTARFVPPPPHEMGVALDNLEKFIHDIPTRTPTLLKAGLAHAQFETIHPFLDGNGRIGRLLITLLFISEDVLSQPLLYISLYFKQHRDEYYDKLQRVRTHGEWEAWLLFYLAGIAASADVAKTTVSKLIELFKADREAVLKLGKGAASAVRVYEHLQHRALLKITDTAKALGLTQPTVSAAINQLEALGIVEEITGKQRDRVFAYGEYLKILSEDVETPTTDQ